MKLVTWVIEGHTQEHITKNLVCADLNIEEIFNDDQINIILNQNFKSFGKFSLNFGFVFSF